MFCEVPKEKSADRKTNPRQAFIPGNSHFEVAIGEMRALLKMKAKLLKNTEKCESSQNTIWNGLILRMVET